MVAVMEALKACSSSMAFFFSFLTWATVNYDERSAALFMADYFEYEQITLSIMSENFDDDKTFTREMLIRDCNSFALAYMRRFPWENFMDTKLQRQFQVVLQDFGYPMITPQLKDAMDVLRNISRSYPSTSQSSDNADALRQNWQQWREQLPHSAVKQSLQQYIDFHRGVNLTKHHFIFGGPERVSDVWYRPYEADLSLIPHMLGVWRGFLPLYQELHGHLRRLLSTQYNANTVSGTEFIPDHLRQMIAEQAQNWHQPLIGEPYPDRQLPNLATELDDSMFNAHELYTSGVYHSMIKGQPDNNFMAKHFIKQTNEGPDCEEQLHVHGSIELHYCPKVTFSSMLQTHVNLAKFEYAFIRNESKTAGFNREACPGYADAIGTAVYLSTLNPMYFQQKLKLFTNYTFDEALNLNRLYRQAVNILFTLPPLLVYEIQWAEMLEALVKEENYNAHYWQNMRNYIGIDAPMHTNHDGYDMSPQFYEGILNERSNPKRLFGVYGGFYLYERICEILGTPQLDHCWFNNSIVTNVFRNLTTPGSSKAWVNIVGDEFGKTADKYLVLRYFDPLHKWLQESNKKHGVKVGWSVIN